MRVKILEERLSTKDAEGTHRVLLQGDTITVSEETGSRWCDRGWAEDADGIYPTGERKVEGVTVTPKNAVHASPRRKGTK